MRNYRSIWGSIAAIAMFTLVSCKSAVDHNKVITVNFGEVNKKRAVNLSDWVLEPEFIEHLKECGLDEEEIRYCCMEVIGVKE